MRRSLVLSTLSLIVTGCAKSPILDTSAQLIKIAVKGFPEIDLTRKMVDEADFASIRVKIEDNPSAWVALKRVQGQNLHWVTTDKKVLVTRMGRLMQTVSFPSDLTHTAFLQPDPIQNTRQKIQGKEKFTRQIDIQPGNHYNILVSSSCHVIAEENIEVLEKKYQTVKVTEDNFAKELDWRFKNHFWFDKETGEMWRSIQYSAPTLPPFLIEVLKPVKKSLQKS